MEGSSEAADTSSHDSDLELEKQKFHLETNSPLKVFIIFI